MPVLDRSGRAGHWLEWKVRIFTAGALLAVAGIYLEARWMTGAAVFVLFSAVLLRFLPRGDHPAPQEDSEDDDA